MTWPYLLRLAPLLQFPQDHPILKDMKFDKSVHDWLIACHSQTWEAGASKKTRPKRKTPFKHWEFLPFCVSSSVIVDSLHFPNVGLNLVLKQIVGKFVQTMPPVMGFEGNKRISPFIILIFDTNSEWASEKTSHLLCQKSDPPLNKNPLNKPVEWRGDSDWPFQDKPQVQHKICFWNPLTGLCLVRWWYGD